MSTDLIGKHVRITGSWTMDAKVTGSGDGEPATLTFEAAPDQLTTTWKVIGIEGDFASLMRHDKRLCVVDEETDGVEIRQAWPIRLLEIV